MQSCWKVCLCTRGLSDLTCLSSAATVDLILNGRYFCGRAVMACSYKPFGFWTTEGRSDVSPLQLVIIFIVDYFLASSIRCLVHKMSENAFSKAQHYILKCLLLPLTQKQSLCCYSRPKKPQNIHI